MITCPTCGNQNRDTARFCGRCQTPLTRTCPHCGMENRISARFCGKCGKACAAAMKSCPSCGYSNRPHAKRCGQCGAPLTTINCPRCGYANRPQARVCGKCGCQLGGMSVQQLRRASYPTGMLPTQSMLNNRYVILQLIAQGGMGAVYKVQDTRLTGTFWALKEMSRQQGVSTQERVEALEMFQREAQLLAQLNHSGLPKVTDNFEENGRHYLVMEFIDGQTLEQIANTSAGFLPEDRVVEWAIQLCEVLEFLHSQSKPIIYRDLKPANVMIETATEQVKLIDFGIVRFYKKGKQKDTVELGTGGYAPPEQYGKQQTDARSDIYALGVTLHHLLTKEDPEQHLFNLSKPRSINHKISKEMEQIIIKATEHGMNDRYQSAQEMRQALTKLKPAPVPAPAPAKKKPVAKKPAPRKQAPVPKKKAPAPQAPRLSLSTNHIDCGTHEKGASVHRDFTVRNRGGGTLSGTVKSDANWIKLKPTKISRNGETVKVTMDTTRLSMERKQRASPPLLEKLWEGTVKIIKATWWIALIVGLFVGFSNNMAWQDTALEWSVVGLTIIGAIYTLTFALQIIIWLVLVHANHFVPCPTDHSGEITVQTNGGSANIAVRITVKPTTGDIFWSWIGVWVALAIEGAVIVSLILAVK